MKKQKTKAKTILKRPKTPDHLIKRELDYEKLSEYIKLNNQSFQFLENKNFSSAKIHFLKTVEISGELDKIKYIESLINYSLSLYYNNEILASYNSLKKAKDLSFTLYEESEEINQTYFLYLRVLSNLCLISLNLNKISDSQQFFKRCISLIKEPKIKDIKIQISMLKELIYIFYRIDSLKKFQEINDKKENIYNNNYNNRRIYNTINGCINLNEKGLYYLYKSFKNNDINLWVNYLNKELNENNIKDISGYTWLLINRFIALNYQKKGGNSEINIKKAFNDLIKFIEENYETDIDIKDNINTIYHNFKNKFNIAVEYYYEIANLENELLNELNDSFLLNNKNIENKENKVLIKLLLKNAIKNLNINCNEEKDLIKNHLKNALVLIENNRINWELLSILNINKDLIKSIKTLFNNLLTIKEKLILREYFHKYKLNTLGYASLKNTLMKRQLKSESFLKNQLQSLEEGSILMKINFSSKGYNEHFFRLCLVDNEYYFSVHKTISDIKPYKVINLKELCDITIGIETDNLKNKITDKFLKEFKPWNLMSFWFRERTYDLYFDNDIEMNKWFEAVYYFNKYILKKNKIKRNLGYYFFNKLKLKMLYKLKNFENTLPIIEQLKYYFELNQLEYFSIPFPKSLILYLKVYKNIDE